MVISCLAVKAKEKSSDSQWLRSVVSSGTLKDKVAALTIQVQVSFFNNCDVIILTSESLFYLLIFFTIKFSHYSFLMI